MLFFAGATKAGTSWMYEYLRGYPEAGFRSLKELLFFTRLDAGGMNARIKRLEREVAGLDSGKAHYPAWVLQQIADRDAFCKVLNSTDPTPDYLRYMTAGAVGKRLVGDLTPEYGLLSVERMRALPDVRWIFLMRDPVSRLWSHVRMLVRRAKVDADGYAAASAAKLDEVQTGRAPDLAERGDYAAIHGNLVQVVAADNWLAMTYEQMMSPARIQRVTRFPGLSNHPAPLKKGVHKGITLVMSDSLRHRARDWLKPQYSYVAAIMGLPPEWERFPELGSEVA